MDHQSSGPTSSIPRIIVSQPLQQAIATLVEESTGRAKHLQQVGWSSIGFVTDIS